MAQHYHRLTINENLDFLIFYKYWNLLTETIETFFFIIIIGIFNIGGQKITIDYTLNTSFKEYKIFFLNFNYILTKKYSSYLSSQE